MNIIINRVWAMPSKHTFKIKPIAKLIGRYVGDGKGWIDPFCGYNSPAEVTNDLNADIKATYNLKALDFLKQLPGHFKGVIFDPPYSNRQIKECYEGVGIDFKKVDGESLFQKEKRIVAHKIKSGGLAISFGWNSGGFGKRLGFKLIEILLVNHGGVKNDTIVTVEEKINNLYS